MRKGFKGFMNKVFKVVWSKSKECYVVVPEIAKNNSGKKKVLASVLAGLAVAGAMGGIAPQQAMADADYGNSHVNVWANTAPDGSNGKNDAGQNSIVVGYQNTTDHTAGNDGKVAIGAKNSATGNSAMAMGNRNVANGGAATAIGAGNESTAATTLTVGNKNNANAENAIAIGAYNNQNWTHGSWQTTPKPAGAYSLAIGNFNDALGSRATAVGAFNTAKGEWATAIGASTVASGNGDVAIGDTTKTNATGVGHAVAVGWHAETGAANAVAVGPSALASGKNSVSVGTNNNSRVQDTVTMGQDNDAKTMGGIAIGKNNMVDSTNGGTNDPETRDENSQIAIGRDNTATHLDTIAIGRDTHATGSGATVVGARADASGNNAIAIGNSGKNSRRVTASGVNSIAVGMRSQATGEATIAQGAAAEAAGNFGIAVGRISKAKANYSQAYGNEATSSTMGSIAMGALAKGGNDNGAASEGGSVAVGNAAWATGNRAIAIGSIRPTEGNLKYPTGVGKDVATGLQGTDYNTQATANQAIAVGSGARTEAQNSITMGTNAKVDATANGYTYQKTNNSGVKETLTLSTDPTPTSGINGRTTYDAGNGIAIGRDSHVTGKTTSAIAIGNSALADDGAVAATVIGAGASSKSVSSVAIGTTANVQGGEGAVAVGSGATVTGNYDNAAAFGSGATVNKTNGTALGAGAQTNVRGGVAIGALSQADERSGAGESTGFHAANRTREYQGENKGLADNNLQLFHADIAGGDAGMVSVGNDGIKRQITNVASGTSDYDAVNVAQLRNVGVVVTGDTGKSDFLVHDGKLNVVGTGRVSTTAANDGAKDSKITVAFDDKGMVKAGKNVTVDEKTVNGRTTYTINAADAAAKYDFLTNATANGGKVDGNATPTKVESGQTVNYAAGKNLTVKQDIQTSLGQQTYTYSLNKDLKEITSITNNGGPTLHFGDNNISVTGGNLDLGDHNITNLKSGGDVINNAANIGDVTRISKANDLHIAPTAGTNNNVAEYTVDGNKKVTLTYQDGNGKTVTGPKAVIDLSGLPTGDMSSFNVKSSATEGKVAQGSAGVQEIRDGKTVEMQAGKNMTVKQTNKNGNAAVEFALNKDIDLTPDGSITIGDTNITDNGLTINNGPSITKTGINAGGLNITNVKAGVNDNDAVNVSQLKKVRADERHIKPGEYAVDANGKVTMTYLDGNNKDVANETAVITGIAKQDLSNINKGGETVIQNLAKKAINMENGKNTKVSNREIDGVKTFKVDVEGDLNDITSITNKAGDGKVVFGGNQTVNVAGDHNINLNAKVGDITGLTNVTLDAPDFAKKGRAATEEQLNIVNNKFNNTVGLTGNTGATELQKLNKQGGLSFGVVGANNGEYIKTTASGSNVVADLSDSAKNKLNSTVVVEGKNAAKVTSNVIQNADGSTKTVYTVDVNNVKPTAASTEKVQAKADVTGSSDKNIAKVSPKAGDQFGEAGATYEVNVSRNDVKDAAREAVTVNTTNTTNNPITVTPVQDETNHNTTYTVTFDGNKAATQIPLTYKANGQNAQTVTLDKGLNFTNGKNTTASVDAEGVVKYDVNKDLVNINSISNTTNGPKMEFGPNSINITNGPINMGNQNITNLKSGGDVINNAANIGDVTRISKANDLHIAPTSSDRTGETTATYAYNTADKSVTLKYNDGNGTTQSGTIAKIDLSGLADQIKDGYSFSTDAKGNVVGNHAVTAVANGKTVSYAAGDNLTVKQDIDATTGEHTYTYALSNDIKVGKDGKDGIDGKIGVNGKDGSSVVINGKDGSIGLNGKDGKDGLTIRGEKGQDGVDGKNGTNGITRIVYEDHNNDKHEVATLDDGMKYAGDDAQGTDKSKVIAKKLNETMDVVGGADKSKLTDNNIGVNNVDGKLKVQLSKEVNLTPSGSLTIGDTVVNNNGLTISGGPSIIKTGINAGNLNITNVKAGVNDTDAVNVKQLKDARTVVTSNDNSVTVNKTENGNQVTYDLHVAPGAAQSVWNVKSTGNTTADSETAAKTISDGKTVEMAAGKNLTVKQTSNNDGAKVEFDLANDIKIGKDGRDGVDGKIGVNGKDGSSVVINGKDGSIGLNGKDGKDGLTMKGEKGADGVTRIVYEDHDNNKHEVATLDDGLRFDANSGGEKKNKLGSKVTVKGTGAKADSEYDSSNIKTSITQGADGNSEINIGLAKDLNNINTIKNGGNATFTIGGDNFAFNGGNVSLGGNNITNLKSGVVNNNDTDNTNAANIGDVKNISKANDIHVKDKTYTVNADKTVTLEYVDGNDNTINKTAKIDLSNLPTGDKAAVESVVKKSAAAGDTNIADITVADGKQTGDANAKYEVNVSRNAVKDAAREAVTVNTTNTTNNPITVTPVQDETNHNTTYQVTFDGEKAAKQIPLTYKANGSNNQTVTLDKGLNFTNGSNTTASVAADGVVKYDLNNNIDLTPNGSLKIGDTILNNGGLTITGGPSVTKTGINAGNLNITNVKAGVNDTDAVNVKQLKDARTVVTSNDNSVTVNKTENGNQVTYDLHVAPGAAQSVWNVKSTGNTTADSETAAKTISDGKTVEMAAGKNLTVKQTSNNDGAKVEFDLANDIKIGKDGRDGVDGKIGVNGKDGSSVVINGKDGSIGLNGKDGKDGLTMKGEKGADGVTRIVYEDHDNNKHEVATLDDGLRFDANSGGEKKNKLGSKVTVKGTGAKADSEYDSSNIKTSITQGADGNSEINIGLAKDLNNINTIKNGGNATFTIGGDNFAFNGGNVSLGGNNITNLKSGIVNNNSTDDTNGANIGDVKTISKANDLHIAPTTSDRTGETTTSYAYDTASKSVTLKYNDGNGANQAGTIAKIDLSGLADQIKDGYSFSTDAKGNVVGNHAVTAVGNGKTVSYAAGDNLTIAQHIDNATGEQTYTYALSNDIKIGKDGKDGVDGKIGVNGKDGSSVVINGKDGSIGLNGKDGKDGLTMKAKDGQPGVNGKDGITRIVYEDNSKNTHEVATLDDGMKYAGDDAQGADKSKVIAKKLNETMDVVGGADKSKLTDNNIGVNNVDGKLKVQLSKEVNLTPSGSLTIGDTVVNNNGLTISGGPSITKTGINAGNLNITNVKAGVNDTDAVNVKQLKDARTVVTSNDNSVTVNKTENGNQVTYDLHVAPGAAQSVWNVKSTGNTTADSETAPKTISDGKTVEMAAGKNLTVKQTSNNDGAKVEFDLANDIKIGNDGKDGKDGVDGKIGVNGKDGSSVVINGKDGSIGLNGKDGKDGLTMKGEKGQPGLNGKDGITRIVYEDNNHDKHEVATLDDGLNFTGNNTDTVNKQKLNSLVKVQGEGVDKNTSATFKSAAGNINVKADGTDTLEVQLNKDLKNINTIKNGGNATFTIGGDNFAFNGGNVSLGGNNITNLKSGIVNNNSTDDTNGANIGDVKTISKANDIHVKDTRYTVNADKTVTLEYVDGNDKKINKTAVIDLSNLPTGGNAITYKANNQNAQTVSLDKGLNFMDGNYTKASVDADGIVKYDVTIGKVKDGVDGKPGVDGNDGIATVKTVVDTINNSGWKGDVTGNTVGNHTATIVKPGTTVNFGAGKNVTVEQIVNAVTGDHTYNYALSDDIKLGKDGKDGVDGRIGVNGKDGSSVVINGKDGSIGLNGKDGKDGLTMKAENGQPGLNGKDGITRIVYEDKNNNKHEVATLDDGLRFTGNNEVENKQKLGSLVKIKGEGVSKDEEATFESAKGNIAVTADGTDTLTVRLNKNIKGIDSIQTKEIHLGTPDNYTTIKKDGDRIKYGDKTIANTDELWTIQANGTDVPANGGKVNVKGADGITVSRTANGEMTISGSGLGTMNSFNVKSTGNTAAGSETAAKKITDGKTVEFSGGNNVTVKQTSSDDGAKVEFALKNNIDLTQDGSVKIGDTKITNGGLVINNGPSITKDGINAGNKQITNVEDGVNDTDAVNVRQLKDAKTKLVDGQNTTVTGDGSKANPYKVNVEGDLNKITSITNKEGDGKLEFKGDQVVNVAGDNTIKLDGKTGDITGLTNKTLDSADFATKGRAATEEQLKLVQQEAAKKSTEKVQAKADANNIAKVAPKAGDTFGAAGATYEVSVDKNDVKDAAREAVTVSGDNKAITVDVQPNATNHTTNYQVNFNGKEAAKQIPLTYKENGSNARTVMLSDGLDFTNGVNTTAHTAANGKVSFDVKGDLTNITSISNNSNGPKMSFGGDSINITGGSLNMGDNYIHNVKAGEKNTDAVNVSQLKAAKTEVEAGRNVTVEHRLGENGQDIYKVNAEAGVDPRVDKLGEEIGHVGAQSAALSALKPIQYDPMEPTQIMAGYGNYRGNSALALGVAHYKNESTMFHAGVSWAGGNGHMMANAGVTWKVGNRDSEAAVADRYRKGPISSTYAMQTEVASMKAQNAGLKGEVSDLKAENEQIKAQNAGLQSEVDQLKAQMAAMMAKLGM